MSQVSRPVQIVLGVTLLFAVVWFVALRPKPADGGASAAAPAPAPQTTPAAPGTEGLKGAIDKAHGAVVTASGDAQRAAQSNADGGGTATSTGTSGSSAATTGGGAGRSAPATGGGAAAATPGAARGASHARATPPAHAQAVSGSVRAIRTALRQHKAVAIAFVDPGTADARAVAQELSHVSNFGGRAVTLAVPLTQLSDYSFITNEVQVTVAPTVVIVDPRRRASTIVGYTDRGEIEQRLADALAVTPKR
jgi:hypothetical protein